MASDLLEELRDPCALRPARSSALAQPAEVVERMLEPLTLLNVAPWEFPVPGSRFWAGEDVVALVSPDPGYDTQEVLIGARSAAAIEYLRALPDGVLDHITPRVAETPYDSAPDVVEPAVRSRRRRFRRARALASVFLAVVCFGLIFGVVEGRSVERSLGNALIAGVVLTVVLAAHRIVRLLIRRLKARRSATSRR